MIYNQFTSVSALITCLLLLLFLRSCTGSRNTKVRPSTGRHQCWNRQEGHLINITTRCNTSNAYAGGTGHRSLLLSARWSQKWTNECLCCPLLASCSDVNHLVSNFCPKETYGFPVPVTINCTKIRISLICCKARCAMFKCLLLVLVSSMF